MDPWQAAVDRRLGALKSDLQGVMGALGRLELALNGVTNKLPHLATAADVEKRPGRAEMWPLVGVLCAAVLAAAALGANLMHH